MEINSKRYKGCNRDFQLQLFRTFKVTHVKFMMYLMIVVSSFILCSQATDLREKKFSEGEPVKYYSYRKRQYFQGIVTNIDPFTVKGHNNCFYNLAEKRTLNGIAAVDKSEKFFYMEENQEMHFEPNLDLDSEENNHSSTAKQLTGVIIKFFPHRGFGFIVSNQEAKNIFVHINDVIDDRKELNIGENVQFDIVYLNRGKTGRSIAKNVSGDHSGTPNVQYNYLKDKNSDYRNYVKNKKNVFFNYKENFNESKEEEKMFQNAPDEDQNLNNEADHSFTDQNVENIQEKGTDQNVENIQEILQSVHESTKEEKLSQNVPDEDQNLEDKIKSLYTEIMEELELMTNFNFLDALNEVEKRFENKFELFKDHQYYKVLKEIINFKRMDLKNITKQIRELCAVITADLANAKTFAHLNILEFTFESNLEKLLKVCQESNEKFIDEINQTRRNFGFLDQLLMPFHEGDRLCVLTAFDKCKSQDFVSVTDDHDIRQKFLPGYRRGIIEVMDVKGKVHLIQSTDFDKLKIIRKKEKTDIMLNLPESAYIKQLEVFKLSARDEKIVKEKIGTEELKFNQKDVKRTCKGENGLEYTGSINKKGQWHGHGVLRYHRFLEIPDDDGFCEISGEWQNNIASGVMNLIAHKNKYKYEGELNANLEFHGHGKKTIINDDGIETTEGGWKNQLFHGNIKRTEVTGEEVKGKFEHGREVGIFSHFFPEIGLGYIVQYPHGYYYKYQELDLGRDYIVDGYKMEHNSEIIDLEAHHVENLSFDELEIALIHRKQNTYPLINKHKKKEILKKRQNALKKFLAKEE